MKTTKFFSTLLLMMLCLGFNYQAQAQTKEITGVRNVSLSNFGPIIEGKEVKGYYTFYAIDKVDKRSNSYVLGILDPNLNEISSQKITLPNTYYLVEASYNEENLLFAFYDAKERKMVLRKYDKQAKFLGMVKQELEKMDAAVIYQSVANEEITNTRIFAVPNKGFLHYSMTKNKKYGFEADFIPSNTNSRAWTYRSSAEAKEVINGGFLHYDAKNNVIMNILGKRKGMMSKDIAFYIQGLDAQTGKQKYETKLEDAKYEIQVFKGYSNEENGTTRLIGMYSEKGSKIKDATLGFCTFSLNEKGQMIDKKFISWAKDVGRLLPVNEKGKLENVGYFYIHNMVSTKDGRVYIISENYKKAVSAGGTALNILAAAGGSGSGVSSFKVVVTDMAIFELTPEFDLKAVKFIDKEKTNVSLPGGAGYMGVHMLGHLAKAYGGFDYSFTQSTKGEDGFIIGYQDYEKVKGEKNGWTFSGLANIDGEYTSDKIDLRTESTYLKVFPAKPGYVMIVEVKIEKKRARSISMRLEKINY